jgi:cell division protein FtsB
MFETVIGELIVCGIVGGCGFLWRRIEDRKTIAQLKHEKAELHAQIVALQAENAALKQQIPKAQTPFLPVAFPRRGRASRALDG